MEQDKKKILSDLYAIRATMSLVAENDENDAEPERKAITDLEREQRNSQSAISNSEEKLTSVLYERKKSAKKRLEELRKDQERKIEELRKDQERKIEELRKNKKSKEYSYECSVKEANRSFASCLWGELWFFGPTFFGVIFAILIIASIALSFALGNLWNNYSFTSIGDYWSGVLITALICLAGICAYFFGVCIPVTVFDRKDDKFQMEQCYAKLQQAERELNEELQQAERNLNAKLQQAERELKNATEIYEAYDERVSDANYSWESPALREVTAPKHNLAEINELIQAHEKEVAALEKKKETLEQQKNPHLERLKANGEKVSAFVESATQAYPLIDLRDWENVDLLIYYFETGRADDMKEALQLVDRQRQTDQITDALEMASAEICKTIHHSMNQLGNALSQSFSLLSSQLSQSFNMVSSQMSQLSSQLSRQHVEMLNAMEEQTAAQQAASEAQLKEIRAQAAAQTTSQVTSQEMNRALLEKISESSSDLAAQMRRQMREVHDIYV